MNDLNVPAGSMPSLRIDPSNPDHHLYRNNGGNWWIHFVLHLPDGTAQRVRRTLGTRDLQEARARRDAVLALLGRKEVAA